MTPWNISSKTLFNPTKNGYHSQEGLSVTDILEFSLAHGEWVNSKICWLLFHYPSDKKCTRKTNIWITLSLTSLAILSRSKKGPVYSGSARVSSPRVNKVRVTLIFYLVSIVFSDFPFWIWTNWKVPTCRHAPFGRGRQVWRGGGQGLHKLLPPQETVCNGVCLQMGPFIGLAQNYLEDQWPDVASLGKESPGGKLRASDAIGRLELVDKPSEDNISAGSWTSTTCRARPRTGEGREAPRSREPSSPAASSSSQCCCCCCCSGLLLPRPLLEPGRPQTAARLSSLFLGPVKGSGSDSHKVHNTISDGCSTVVLKSMDGIGKGWTMGANSHLPWSFCFS